MKILGIETALGFSEVALLEEGKDLLPRTLADGTLYSENVVKLMRTLLRASSMSLGELDGIAVSIGPGSFTGLRIGLSAAKGLAGSANRPLVGVSTLDALAGSVVYSKMIETGCEFLAVIDAKRDDYYCASFYNDRGKPSRTSEPQIVTAYEICHSSPENEKVIVVGDGKAKLEQRLRDVRISGGSELRIIQKGSLVSPAAAVAILGLQKIKRGELADAVSLEPSYLKDFLIHTRS